MTFELYLDAFRRRQNLNLELTNGKLKMYGLKLNDLKKQNNKTHFKEAKTTVCVENDFFFHIGKFNYKMYFVKLIIAHISLNSYVK